MDLALQGKTAIVTGGASNIGRRISLTLGREGANVVIVDLDPNQGNKVVQEIVGAGGKAVCIETDVTSLPAVEAMFKQSVDSFGQVHVLVNNVGWDKVMYFLETDPALWDKLININYRSNLNTFKTVLPHMIENGYGRIVSIASEAGRIGEFRESVYSGLKAGVIALSKSIAREVGRHNITVNTVCPGLTMPEDDSEVSAVSMWAKGRGEVIDFFPTEVEMAQAAKRFPLRRVGRPQDIANAVAFLSSDAASFITGQALSVSGGYTMIGS
ncbi:MAG: SDR family oxidoreductase [Chloroflexota bacterium]|nr:MAG: SDR family oxidoreductase [Chloroflexota bacterium]